MTTATRTLAALFLTTLSLAAQREDATRYTPVALPAPKPAVLELTLEAQGKDLLAVLDLPGAFFGGLLLADDPSMRYFLVDLPGMLAHGVLVATGKSDTGHLEFLVPGIAALQREILGLEIHGQALAVQGVVLASEVVPFAPAK